MATSYSQACGEECPEYMYEYNKIKESWISCCSQKSSDCGVEATKFFKRVYNRHLSKSVFVTAFDCHDSVKLFVDFILYNRIKAKLQRNVGFKVPHIAPTRLSKRRLPCRKHIFASEGDLNRCLENLRRKNDEILFQKNVRGIRLLDQLRDHISEKSCKILALDLEVYEENPSEILEIGCVLFRMVSLETRSQVLACNHYIIRDNKHLKNECLMPDNRDRFRFGVSHEISMSEAKKIIEDLSLRVEYITAHAAENLTAYLKERGIDIRGVKVIDTKLLHTAVSPFVGDHVQRDLRWVMNDLEIPLDMNNNIRADDVLHNAGNDAFYTMEVFATLVRMRPIETGLI